MGGPIILMMLGMFVGADKYDQAPIIPGSTPLEEPGRYQVARTFDDTVDYFKRSVGKSGGVRWRNIVNLPGIKAVHLASIRKRKWLGINIYEKGGVVRYYIIPREKTKKKK